MSKPSCQQQEQQSLGGRQESWRLLAESEKFAQHVMVSAGVCFGSKGRLHFVDESTKVDSAYYVGVSFPVLSTTALDCCPVDTSSSKTARQHTQLVPRRTGSKPTTQISLPKTSGLRIHSTWSLEPLGLPCLGAMLEAYHKRHPKPKTIAELKEVLQVIWDSLPQRPIDKAVKEFSKRLKACVAADGGHFEHS